MTYQPTRLAPDTYVQFCEDFARKKFTTMRLGQAFCNVFGIGPRPELFYAEDPAVAQRMIDEYLRDYQIDR
jgi:hypothetical protein